MKEITVFAKVGRADPRPLGTFSSNAHADAAQAAHLLDLQKSGVCHTRVSFERTGDAAATTKKGKK